jgi:hypothetical protein
MYVTKDIYSDSFIIAIPVITFSCDIREEHSEKDYEWLRNHNLFGDLDTNKKLVEAIKEAISEFE